MVLDGIIYVTTLIRCEENCPICVTLNRKRKKITAVITRFHEKCIEAFENFNSNKLLQIVLYVDLHIHVLNIVFHQFVIKKYFKYNEEV